MSTVSARGHPGSTPSYPNGTDQVRGSVLLITLLFATIISTLVLAVLAGAGLQQRLALNNQVQEQTLNHARAMATEVSLRKANFLIDSNAGQENCLATDASNSCDFFTLAPVVLPPLVPGLVTEYRVTRRVPLLRAGLPTRDSQSRASSVRTVSTALFDVEVVAGNAADRRGSTRVTRGVAVRVQTLP